MSSQVNISGIAHGFHAFRSGPRRTPVIMLTPAAIAAGARQVPEKAAFLGRSSWLHEFL